MFPSVVWGGNLKENSPQVPFIMLTLTDGEFNQQRGKAGESRFESWYTHIQPPPRLNGPLEGHWKSVLIAKHVLYERYYNCPSLEHKKAFVQSERLLGCSRSDPVWEYFDEIEPVALGSIDFATDSLDTQMKKGPQSL